MERITPKDFHIKKSSRKKSKEMILAEEVCNWLGEKTLYPLILKCVREKGWQYIFETYKSIKARGICDKRYFLGAVLKTKIQWKSIK